MSLPVTTTKGSEKAMIESIEFTNFKALRKTTLPLSPFTLLLGPNGSGKTSVLQALQRIAAIATTSADKSGKIHVNEWSSIASVTAEHPDAEFELIPPVEITVRVRVRVQPMAATF